MFMYLMLQGRLVVGSIGGKVPGGAATEEGTGTRGQLGGGRCQKGRHWGVVGSKGGKW